MNKNIKVNTCLLNLTVILVDGGAVVAEQAVQEQEAQEHGPLALNVLKLLQLVVVVV